MGLNLLTPFRSAGLVSSTLAFNDIYRPEFETQARYLICLTEAFLKRYAGKNFESKLNCHKKLLNGPFEIDIKL